MRRSTLILLILLVALGALYWYMQKPGNVVQQALATSTPATSVSLPDLIGPGQIPVSQINVQSADGKKVQLKNTGSTWTVTTDHTGPADLSQAQDAAMTVASLNLIAKLDPAPDPAGTGLDHPAYTVSLTLADGSLYTFQVGKPTVTRSGYYVQAQDGSVVIVAKDKIDVLLGYLSQPPFMEAKPTATP